jgi:hypothetical protein
MGRLNKVYTVALLGALGGLAGSYLHQRLLLAPLAGMLAPAARLACLALLGLLIGAAIGFVPSFADGLGAFSLVRRLRAGLIGAGFGALGGLVALPLAEVLHVRLGGGVLGRALALAVLGCAVGVAEGLNGGARWWRGVLGGLAGGGFAGVCLEALLAFPASSGDSGIVALVLIGLCITLMIGLFVNVLAEAWLEGQGGKLSGQLYHLGKFTAGSEAVIGSEKKGTVFIWVADAAPRHAAIALTPAGARLRSLEGAVLRVDGNPVREHLLRDGEVIEVGSARLLYRERRRTQWRSAPGK